jgi:uncharacterized integral membrane protein
MTWLRIVVILIFVIVFLIWAGQNLENTVTINNFSGKPVTTSPLWMVVLAAAAFGIFFMGILGIAQELKDKTEIKRLNRVIDNLQEELSSLRSIPLSDEIGVEEVKEKEKPRKSKQSSPEEI